MYSGPSIVLFDDNNAQGNQLCLLSWYGSSANVNQYWTFTDNVPDLDKFALCDNDAAKSMWLCRAKAGDTITIFDDGQFRYTDDYTVITVKEDFSWCETIGTFEPESNVYDNSVILVERMMKTNGRSFQNAYGDLDGKVSSIRVEGKYKLIRNRQVQMQE